MRVLRSFSLLMVLAFEILGARAVQAEAVSHLCAKALGRNAVAPQTQRLADRLFRDAAKLEFSMELAADQSGPASLSTLTELFVALKTRQQQLKAGLNNFIVPVLQPGLDEEDSLQFYQNELERLIFLTEREMRRERMRISLQGLEGEADYQGLVVKMAALLAVLNEDVSRTPLSKQSLERTIQTLAHYQSFASGELLQVAAACRTSDIHVQRQIFEGLGLPRINGLIQALAEEDNVPCCQSEICRDCPLNRRLRQQGH